MPDRRPAATRPATLTDAIRRFRPYIKYVVGGYRLPSWTALDDEDLLSIGCIAVADVYVNESDAPFSNNYVKNKISWDIAEAAQYATRQKRRPPESVISLDDAQYETEWLINDVLRARVAPSAEDVVIRREELGMVVNGLLGLPQDQRRSLISTAFGCPQHELAAEEGCSAGAIRSRAAAGRRGLRAALAAAGKNRGEQ